MGHDQVEAFRGMRADGLLFGAWECVGCGSEPMYPVQSSLDPRWGISECSNINCPTRSNRKSKRGNEMRTHAPFRRIG